MKKHLRRPTVRVLALAFTLSILISVDCLAVSPSPSCQSISAGLECDANKSDESGKIRQSPTTHAQIESKKSALNLEGSAKPLSKTLKGALVGTGWPTVSGYVVTSNHVVSGSNDVVVISSLGEELPAQAVLRDAVNDIALLEVSDTGKLPPALPLAKTKARLGTSVFTIGFPRVHYMGKTPKLFTGVISGVNGLRDDPASYHTTVPIQPGNSGGPLLNMKGEVVGVVTSMLGVRDKESGNVSMLPNASYVLKIASVKNLLPQLPKREHAIEVLPRRSGSLETLAERIEGSVLMVVGR
jgi:S1-C subfamily serine protease